MPEEVSVRVPLIDVPQTEIRGGASNAPPTIPKSMEGLKRFDQMFNVSSDNDSSGEQASNTLPLTP